ncbi:Maintenance of mitochondrial morphology protein 1 [Neofusicoccum parvum]|uniref:Maintenance of mitochondrial morphology protein 1 n=1 Tax=Neofusicoccum parvum TaxID=310453 RepID=A0ACB5SFA1_9PEZI|nr:Maintenance of mitochondrial morphology protein 1 [Neofusicoccum parvum]
MAAATGKSTNSRVAPPPTLTFAPPDSPAPAPQPTGLSFTQGFLLGQLSVTLLIFFFIKFFIFGEPPPADIRHATRAAERRERTLSHQRNLTTPSSLLRHKRSTILRPPPPVTSQTILAKTYYNVKGHQPESLDWFNVLIAQTIAQLRADARQDDAVLTSLTNILNGPTTPDWLGEICVTEIELGDEFPIFSNCRVIPVDDGGLGLGSPNKSEGSGANEGRLQARMDVDLSDVITLGIETTLMLNWPRPKVAVLPVALAVSVVRFSGTVSLSDLNWFPFLSRLNR